MQPKRAKMSALLSMLLITLTASWTAGDATQTGFKLSYGTGLGTYETVIDVGNVTKYTHDYDFGNLQRVCFVCQAYNSFGTSPFSNEVCLSVPKKPVTLSVK